MDRVGFHAVTNLGRTRRTADREKYWWSKDLGRWGTFEEVTGQPDGYGSHLLGVRSVRAFRRRLKQWSKYLPKGTPFVLVSRWRGYNVYGKTS
jgi:hypothetical protein